MNLDNQTEIKKRLVKDYNLPIKIVKEPYFSYFVNLYDNLYKTKEKIAMLENVLTNCNHKEDFFSLSFKLKDAAQTDIKNSNTYKLFNSNEFIDILNLKDCILQNQNLYIDENINKDLISIDLNKANFNVFNLYGLNQELNYFTYEEFVKKYINYDYFAKSKSLRQVIFGELNASRQQTVQKQILKHFAKNLEILNLNIKMLSSDEIIIEPKNIIKDLQDVKNILLSINKNLQFYSVNHITLEKIDKNHPFFVKKTYMDNDTKIEFKGVNDIFLPQVYKKYFNLELNEFDLTFFHEGFLAQFKDKLFEPELNQKNKLKP